MSDLTVGFALTGSYCTFKKVIPEVSNVAKLYETYPIMSENAQKTDTRFGKAVDFIDILEKETNHKLLKSMVDVEPIGPKKMIDALIIAPCTGNTLSKLANGIVDTCVTMAAKSTLRNNCPVIIAVSTNDGLANCAKNIGVLLNNKNIYFVPFSQDDPIGKERSLVADMTKITETLELALKGQQIEPILY